MMSLTSLSSKLLWEPIEHYGRGHELHNVCSIRTVCNISNITKIIPVSLSELYQQAGTVCISTPISYVKEP